MPLRYFLMKAKKRNLKEGWGGGGIREEQLHHTLTGDLEISQLAFDNNQPVFLPFLQLLFEVQRRI